VPPPRCAPVAARLGVLDVFRGKAGSLTGDELAIALTFADVTVAALLDRQEQEAEQAGPDAEPATAELEHHAELFQAQGMVMVQLGSALEEAMSRIRAYAYAEQFMAGSNETVRIVELFQLQTSEGPCLKAFHGGSSVINMDLAEAVERWPRFAPHALAAGFRSVHAFPLRLRSQVIGALNVFGASKGGDFEDSDVLIMQALADVASIGLLQERAIRRGEILTEQLQGALNSRVVIEQAKGAVAQALGVSVDDAFGVIRRYARRNNEPLTGVARSLVTDPASMRRFLEQ
jgi:GAF domain-containing protein